MIEEAYCSFEIAKLLKEKGFDISPYSKNWVCCMYDESGNIHWGVYDKNWYFRITHQMAMAWMREVHNIIFVFKPASFSGEECTSWTYEIWAGDNFEGEIMSFKTYEEAVEAALKYSLENLI